MILDALLVFDPNPTSVAIAAGTQASTNTIDLGIKPNGLPTPANGGGARDLGVGDNPALKVVVTAVVGFTSGGAGTLSVAVQGAPDDGTGAPGAWTTYLQTPAAALANLGAGARILSTGLPRPPQGAPLPRFLRLQYTVGTATMTAGSVFAALVLDEQAALQYPAGQTVQN